MIAHSKLLTPAEFAQERRRWNRLYRPTGIRNADLWHQDWQTALKQIPYLRVTRSDMPARLDLTVDQRGELAVSRANLEPVLADLQAVWRGSLGARETSMHTFSERADLLIFEAAARDSSDDTFICRLQMQFKDR